MNETIIDSAGSNQPALKHVLVSPERYEQIQKTTKELKQLFLEKAKAQGVTVKQTGRNRNMPGQADAIEYLLRGQILNTLSEFVDEFIQEAKGAL